eukprot:15326200-Heterocapsa_arctica.AAC.1
MSNSSHLVDRAIQGGDPESALWCRGIVPLSWYQEPLLPWEEPKEWCFTGPDIPRNGPLLFASDGSGGKYGNDPRLRRVGFASVLVHGGNGEPFGISWAAFGGVGGSQTVPRAEGKGFVTSALKAGGEQAICLVDAKYVVNCFNPSNTSALEGLNSDIWSQVRSSNGDSLVPGVSVKWIKAHQDRTGFDLDYSPLEIYGNSVADALAEEAASRVADSTSRAFGIKAMDGIVKKVLDRLMAIEAHIAKEFPRVEPKEGWKHKKSTKSEPHSVAALSMKVLGHSLIEVGR